MTHIQTVCFWVGLSLMYAALALGLRWLEQAKAHKRQLKARVYLLIEEGDDGYFPVGIYSTPQKALAAMRTLKNSFECTVREYEVDDAEICNYVSIHDPR